MVPAQGAGAVAPGNIEFQALLSVHIIKNITPEIATQVQPILVGKNIIHLSIQIVKIVSCLEFADLL